MILDLREFEEFPAQVVLVVGPNEIDPQDDRVMRLEDVSVELSIQKAAQEFFCQGSVKARVVMECARCLTPFETELSEPTDFIVCSETPAAERDVIDDEDYVYFQGNDLKVDIVEPVRQAIVLALPLKPVCNDACRGLCSQCGANLNDGSCTCEVKVDDPRWDGLKDLFPKK